MEDKTKENKSSIKEKVKNYIKNKKAVAMILEYILTIECFAMLFLAVTPGEVKAATTATDENGITWAYTLYNGKATNVYYASGELSETVTIPSTLDGYPVENIGKIFGFSSYNIFSQNYESIKNIEIPNSVTSIGESAFSGCSSLISVNIPNGVTSIEFYTFKNCSSLIEVEIPSSVTSIGQNAFSGCSSLTKLEIPNGVTSIQSNTFSECSSLTEVKIPDSVTSIGAEAFSSCRNLTSIEIPNSVTSIGYEAFYRCYSLTEIEIPDSVTYIQSEAFKNCISLESIVIPSSVTSIGQNAFEGCSSLTEIEIPSSVTVIGLEAFKDCKKLSSITVSEQNTKYVSEGNILYDKNKTILIKCADTKEGNIIIPNTVIKIERSSFYDCSSVTSIEIPNSVTSIGYEAFKRCVLLKSIEVPESVTDIESRAFYGCYNLKDIYVNNEQSNITLGSNWSGVAYVHYKDCKHTITKLIEQGLEIEEVSNNLEDEKIVCREDYKFKVKNLQGETITDKIVKMTLQGVTKEITPNENGIYIIEGVNRDITLMIGKQNGEKFQATDENGIVWNYTYQDGKAIEVYYESGELDKTVIIPSTLDGYPVENIYNKNGVGRNIFVKSSNTYNTTVEKVIIQEGVESIGKRCIWIL